MGNSVDKRVVELEFNNERFEAGVAESIRSLEKMDAALESSSFQSNPFENLERSLSRLGETSSAGRVTSALASGLESVGSVVDNVVSKVSHLGTILGTVGAAVAGLAAGGVIGAAVSGGKRRAQNLEMSNFMLEGLFPEDVGKEDGIIAKIGDQVKQSVNDTAYGYDQASKAAAQLAASGVEVGEAWDDTTKSGGQLATALRGITGVAAMTGAEYDSIAQIFTTVAGNGKVMASELNRIGMRGLNARAALAEYLGLAESDIAEMTRKGEIDFQTFSNAMSAAFGDQASRANETFSGSLANIKASLSRMGEQFATPAYDLGKRIFQGLLGDSENKGPIKQFEEVLTPISGAWSSALGQIGDGAVDFLEKLGKTGAISKLKTFSEGLVEGLSGFAGTGFHGLEFITSHLDDIFSMFGNIGDIITKPITAISEGISKAFGGKELFSAEGVFESIKNTIESLRPSEDVLSTLSTASETFANALLAVKDAAVLLGDTISPFLSPALNTITTIINSVKDKVTEFVKWLGDATGGINPFETFLTTTGDILLDFFHLFDNGMPSMDSLLDFFGRSKDKIGEFLGVFSDRLSELTDRLLNFSDIKIGEFFEWISELSGKVDLGAVFQAMSEGLGEAAVAVSGFLESLDLVGGIDTVLTSLSSVGETVKNTAEDLKKGADTTSEASDQFKTAFYKFSNFGDTVRTNLETIGEAISGFFAGLTKNDIISFGSVLTSFGVAVGAVSILLNLRSLFKGVVGIVEQVQGLVGSLQGLVDSVGGLFNSLGTALTTFATGFKKGFNKLGIAAVIVSLAVALGVIALSLYGLSKIDDGALKKSLLVIAAAMLALVGLVYLVSKISEKSKGGMALERVSASLLGFAASILILAVAAAAFAIIPPDGILKVVVAVAALVGVAALLSTISNKLGSFLKIAVSLDLLAASLLGIAVACMLFAVVPISGMEKVAAVVVALVGVVFMLSMISHAFGSFIKVAVGLNLVVTALLGMAVACVIFAAIPAQSILMAAAAMVVLAMAAALLGKAGSDASFLAIGAALIGMAVALVLVAGACKLLEGVEWGTLAMAGVALAALIAALSLLSWFESANGNLGDAAVSMIKMSAALLLVAAAIKVISTIPFEALAASVGAFVVVLLLLGAAVGLLTAFPVAQEALLLLATALHTISMSMLIGAAAVAAFTIALTLLGALGPAAMMGVVAAIEIFLDGIISLAPKLLVALTLLIEVAALALANGAIVVAEALVLVFLAVLQKALEYGPIIADTIVAILISIAFKIMEYSGLFVAVAVDMIAEFAMGLATAIRVETPRILGAFEGLFASVGYLLSTLVADLIDGIWPGNPISEGLRKDAEEFKAESEAQEQRFKDAGASLTERWLEGVREKSPDASKILGEQLGGMLGQLGEAMPQFNMSGSDLGTSTVEGWLSSYGGLPGSVGTIDAQTLEQMGLDGSQFEAIMGGAGADSSSAFTEGFSTLPEDTGEISSSATESIIEQFQKRSGDLSSSVESTMSKVPEATEAGMAGTDKKVDSVLDRTQSAISNKSSSIRSTTSSTFRNVPAGASAGSSGTVSKVEANVSGVPSMISSYGDSAYSSSYGVGANVGRGMEDGILSRISSVAAASARMVRAANDAAKAESKEGSPSRVMHQKGVWYAQGFINGIRSLYSDVSKTSGGMVRSAIDSTVQGFGELAGALDGIDYNPVIRPVFDGSKLEAGIHRANRLMVQNQMVSAGYAGRRSPVVTAQAASGYTNNISISLNYEAGADANQIVRDLGMALRSRNIMEG